MKRRNREMRPWERWNRSRAVEAPAAVAPPAPVKPVKPTRAEKAQETHLKAYAEWELRIREQNHRDLRDIDELCYPERYAKRAAFAQWLATEGQGRMLLEDAVDLMSARWGNAPHSVRYALYRMWLGLYDARWFVRMELRDGEIFILARDTAIKRI